MSLVRTVLSSLAVLFLLLAIACGGGSNSTSGGGSGTGGTGGGGTGGGNTTPPPTVTITASPTTAATGQMINFTWTSTNATSISITPSIAGEDQNSTALSGSALSAAPAATTTYTATAKGANSQTATAMVTVNVVAPTLTASQTTISSGNTVTLSWTAPNNGGTLTLSGVPNGPVTVGGPTGSMTVQPAATTTYILTATGPNGGAATAQVTVTVVGAVRVTLTPATQTIQPGASATLQYATQNAVSLTINGQNITPVAQGTYNTGSLNTTTTYTAVATDQFGGTQGASATVVVSSGGPSNINHIIFMVQENRSFDNYFGSLAQYRVSHQPPIKGAQLSDVDDLHNLPSNFTLTNPEGQKFAPYHQRTECTENLSPSWDESHYDTDIQNGTFLQLQGATFKMDNFLQTTRSVPELHDPTHTRPLGYYDQTDLPFYYELAARFATSDRFYSPVLANTVPNRMYLFAATSFGHAFPPDTGHPPFTQATIFRALNQAGISWRYYYQDNSVFLADWADWNDPKIRGNVYPISDWYSVLASPTADRDLPQVVFIERAGATNLDEHPDNNIQPGAAVVQKIMTALFNSGAWQDSAFILAYDEGGGLFDHAAPFQEVEPDNLPPQDLPQGDNFPGNFNLSGFRVPMLVISPWVKPSYVSHEAMDYTAILKMIETRFNVPALTARDAAEPDMWGEFFDFTAPNMLNGWQGLPNQPTNGTCDQTLESSPNQAQ